MMEQTFEIILKRQIKFILLHQFQIQRIQRYSWMTEYSLKLFYTQYN